MKIGEKQFGSVVFGGLIQGTPVFPILVFGENTCLSVSDQVEKLTVSNQVENLSIAKVCSENR